MLWLDGQVFSKIMYCIALEEDAYFLQESLSSIKDTCTFLNNNNAFLNSFMTRVFLIERPVHWFDQYSANQWTGFHMIRTSIRKELRTSVHAKIATTLSWKMAAVFLKIGNLFLKRCTLVKQYVIFTMSNITFAINIIFICLDM